MELKNAQELVKGIRDAVRGKAQEIPTFRNNHNGTIRITLIPECREADNWLGGLGDFSEEVNPFAGITRGHNDVPRYEYVFTVVPGGSHVITTEEGGQPCQVDCSGYSALKTAYCLLAEHGGGPFSGTHLGLDYLNMTEEYGYAPHLGAMYIEVTEKRRVLSDWDFLFCKVCVCTSGATQDEDLKCSLASVPVIKQFFLSHSKWFNFSPPTYVEARKPSQA